MKSIVSLTPINVKDHQINDFTLCYLKSSALKKAYRRKIKIVLKQIK